MTLVSASCCVDSKAATSVTAAVTSCALRFVLEAPAKLFLVAPSFTQEVEEVRPCWEIERITLVGWGLCNAH